MYENWVGVDIMYYLDGRRRRQSLVYFGSPQDSSANVAAGPRELRLDLPPPRRLRLPRRAGRLLQA